MASTQGRGGRLTIVFPCHAYKLSRNYVESLTLYWKLIFLIDLSPTHVVFNDRAKSIPADFMNKLWMYPDHIIRSWKYSFILGQCLRIPRPGLEWIDQLRQGQRHGCHGTEYPLSELPDQIAHAYCGAHCLVALMPLSVFADWGWFGLHQSTSVPRIEAELVTPKSLHPPVKKKWRWETLPT